MSGRPARLQHGRIANNDNLARRPRLNGARGCAVHFSVKRVYAPHRVEKEHVYGEAAGGSRK